MPNFKGNPNENSPPALDLAQFSVSSHITHILQIQRFLYLLVTYLIDIIKNLASVHAVSGSASGF